MADTIQWVPYEELPETIRHAWRMVLGMPFENLTKIISYHEAGGSPELALREPEQVLQDHRKYGTGATCFALVYLFQHLLRQAGQEVALRTCDRYYGEDTHAAAVFCVGGTRWMFDPGYHICQPLPEHGAAAYRLPTNPNASRVSRVSETAYECSTGHQGNWKHRFVLKDYPVSDAEYRRAWADSFRVDMMGYPVLNRFENGKMVYLQKSQLIVRDLSAGSVEKHRAADITDLIQEHYGISRRLAARALDLMGR